MTDSSNNILPIRFQGLDGLRAYAVIGIVMMHVLTNQSIHPTPNFITTRLIPWFTNFTLLFMIVSGFSLSCGYFEKISKGTISPSSFYKKRYIRLLPFFGLMCIIEFVYSPSIRTFYETFANLTMCFGLIPDVHISVIGVGWFIGVVMVYYMLFPFIVFLQKTKTSSIITFFLSLALVWAGLELTTNPSFERQHIAYTLPLFLIGGIFYKYRKSLQKIGQEDSIRFFIAFIAMAVVTLPFILTTKSAFITLIVSLTVFGIWTVYAIISKDIILNNRIVRYILATYHLNLCHMVIYRAVEKLDIARFISNSNLLYLITFLTVIIGSIAFSAITKRYAIDVALNKLNLK